MLLEELPYHYPLSLPSRKEKSSLRGGHLYEQRAQPSRYMDEMRRYHLGDPIHSVDWRQLARSDEWWVRKTYDPTRIFCSIYIDSTDSMFWPNKYFCDKHKLSDCSKHHVALRIAWNIGYTLLKSDNSFSIKLIRELPTDSKSNNYSVWESIKRTISQKHELLDLYHIWQEQENSALTSDDFFSKEKKQIWDYSQCNTYKCSYIDQAEDTKLNNDVLQIITDQMTQPTVVILISDLIHPKLQFISSQMHINTLHILSRLECNVSWIKHHAQYHHWSSDFKMIRGKDIFSCHNKALNQWKEMLTSSTKNILSLHTHSLCHDYQNIIHKMFSLCSTYRTL